MKVDTLIIGAGTDGLSALREVRRHTDDFLPIKYGHTPAACRRLAVRTRRAAKHRP